MLDKQYYFYILTNSTNKVLYCGITDNLIKRVSQHKQHTNPLSFTAKYRINKLVYYEVRENPESAIAREKQIKGGSRRKKIILIEKMNPTWRDLFQDILE